MTEGGSQLTRRDGFSSLTGDPKWPFRFRFNKEKAYRLSFLPKFLMFSEISSWFHTKSLIFNDFKTFKTFCKFTKQVFQNFFSQNFNFIWGPSSNSDSLYIPHKSYITPNFVVNLLSSSRHWVTLEKTSQICPRKQLPDLPKRKHLSKR